jgi:hypothetical protein
MQRWPAASYERAHLVSEFRLRSGAISDKYFDKYLCESDPELLRASPGADHPRAIRPVNGSLAVPAGCECPFTRL